MGRAISQKEFYAFRDGVFALIEQNYGKKAYELLPGNPFAAFSHGSIKDSWTKNYQAEHDSFVAMVAKYYPALVEKYPNLGFSSNSFSTVSGVKAAVSVAGAVAGAVLGGAAAKKDGDRTKVEDILVKGSNLVHEITMSRSKVTDQQLLEGEQVLSASSPASNNALIIVLGLLLLGVAILMKGR